MWAGAKNRVSFSNHKCVWSLLLPFASYHLPTPRSVTGDWRTKTMLIPPDNLGGAHHRICLWFESVSPAPIRDGRASSSVDRSSMVQHRGGEFNSSNARPCVLIRYDIKITPSWLEPKLKCLSSMSSGRYPHLIVTFVEMWLLIWPWRISLTFLLLHFYQHRTNINIFYSLQTSALSYHL